MNDSERYGRAERQLRAAARRLEAPEGYRHPEVAPEPERLRALADEAEDQRYQSGEKALDLDERITAELGDGWDDGPEPDVWEKGAT